MSTTSARAWGSPRLGKVVENRDGKEARATLDGAHQMGKAEEMDRGVEQGLAREAVQTLGRLGKEGRAFGHPKERARGTGRAANAANRVISHVNATLIGQELA